MTSLQHLADDASALMCIANTPLAVPRQLRMAIERHCGLSLEPLSVYAAPAQADTLSANRSVALAGLAGRDSIWLAEEPAWESAGGWSIFAHELAHVLQLRRGSMKGSRLMHDDVLEKEADDFATWLQSAVSNSEGSCHSAGKTLRPQWLEGLPAETPRENQLLLPLYVLMNTPMGWMFNKVPDHMALPVAPTGYTRFFDPTLGDLVDVPDFMVPAYGQPVMQRPVQQPVFRPTTPPQPSSGPPSFGGSPRGSTGSAQPTKPLTPKVGPLVSSSTLSSASTSPLPVSTKNSSLPVATKPVDTTAVILDYPQALALVFQNCFTQQSLLKLRAVSKLFRDVAEDVVWRYMVGVTGHSSILGNGKTPDHPSLKQVMQARFKEIHDAGGKALVASDQVTDRRYFWELVGVPVSIHINIGSIDKAGLSKSRDVDAQMVPSPSPKGRPHTKFVAGGGAVTTGSPNLTPSGMNPGGNIETAVTVGSLQVQGFFNRYWELMRASSPADRAEFTKLVNAFNRRDQPMRLALAPFVSIQPFVLTEVEGASEIIIRMFLVSHLDTNDDIVSGLNALAKRGAQITMVIDEGQAEISYVKQALAKLSKNTRNVTVMTQSRAGSGAIMHDKLILAKFNDGPATRHRVMIGTSGFTQTVMRDENYDLMVSIDSVALYNYFDEHHQASLKGTIANTKPFQYRRH